MWSKKYEIILCNAEGNGNIVARYQDLYQNGEYDIIFTFVDTDRKPYEQYLDIKRKINDIYGIDNAADQVVIYGNPCTLQIVLLHFDDVFLTSHNKRKNAPVVEKYTQISNYKARKDQRKTLFELITVENYWNMIQRMQKLSNNDRDKCSTNFGMLQQWLISEDDTWISELNKKLDT